MGSIQDRNRYGYEKFLSSDDFYMHQSILEEHPDYQPQIANALLMKNKDKFSIYKSSNLIEVNNNGVINHVSADLLYDILKSEGMYKYLLSRFYRYDSTGIEIYLFAGDMVDNLRISKAELSLAFKQLNPNRLNSNDNVRLIFVQAYMTVGACFNTYDGEIFNCIIDDKEYEIEASSLLSLLTCSEEEYRRFLNETIKMKYDKKIMAYLLVDFCERESIFDRFVFDDKEYAYTRYNEIKEYKLINYESVNKFNKSNDEYEEDGSSKLDKFDINPLLIDKIMEYNDDTYSPLEKALYIYIRLCDLLEYDEEQFINNDKFETQGIHSSLDYINNITPDNNRIVSFEFMLIYAKLLRDLGINYQLNLNSMAGYGNEKSSIKFRHDEYLISIDLFSKMIKNDMNMVKIGGTLSSIHSVNTNEMTVRKFDELLYRIYIKYKQTIERRTEFLENVKEYKIKYNKTVATKKDKLFVLFKLIARKDLKGLDSINYINEILVRILGNDDSITYEIYAKECDNRLVPVIVINNDDNCYIIDVNSSVTINTCTSDELDDIKNDLGLIQLGVKKQSIIKEGNNHVK